MEAAQRDFLDAQRRWDADEKGTSSCWRCNHAEQRLLAAFYDGWNANMRLKNLVYSHFAWDWIIRGVLRLRRRKPSWFDRPVMMKLTLSTPHHALKNLAKSPLTRPNNFMMIPQITRFGYPQDVDPNKCTFVTSFSSDREQ